MTDWQRGFLFGFIAAEAVCCAVLCFIAWREARRER